jgi:hypothetical protein
MEEARPSASLSPHEDRIMAVLQDILYSTDCDDFAGSVLNVQISCGRVADVT